jgi:uncharacterized protein with PIN domain
MLDFKVKTGETLCPQCNNMITPRMDSVEKIDKILKKKYWEVSRYCTSCGCFIYSYNVYQE